MSTLETSSQNVNKDQDPADNLRHGPETQATFVQDI